MHTFRGTGSTSQVYSAHGASPSAKTERLVRQWGRGEAERQRSYTGPVTRAPIFQVLERHHNYLPGTASMASFQLHEVRTLLITTTSNVLHAFHCNWWIPAPEHVGLNRPAASHRLDGRENDEESVSLFSFKRLILGWLRLRKTIFFFCWEAVLTIYLAGKSPGLRSQQPSQSTKTFLWKLERKTLFFSF